MADVGFFLGALVGSYVIVSVVNWILSKVLKVDADKLILISGVSGLFLASILAGFGNSNGGQPNFINAFISYLIPIIIVTGIKFYFIKKKK